MSWHSQILFLRYSQTKSIIFHWCLCDCLITLCHHIFELKVTCGISRLHPIYVVSKVSAFNSAKELWKGLYQRAYGVETWKIWLAVVCMGFSVWDPWGYTPCGRFVMSIPLLVNEFTNWTLPRKICTPSIVASPTFQEGQSERTFSIFAFFSLIFPLSSWIFLIFSLFLAIFSLSGVALCPPCPPSGYTTVYSLSWI